MLKDQLPLISSIVNLSIIVSILIVLNSYQAFVIDRSFPKDWIQEVTQETLAQVPYKEFYGLPLECNSDRNLVETYQKCQNDSISAWKLKPEQLLTDSKEFCCFMKKVLSCETEPLRDCDEEYAKENSDETNQLLSACSESSLACQTAAQKDDESIWIIIISAVLSALGMAGLGFYCYPLRKFFLSKFTGKHLDLNYYNAIKNGWRMKILPRRFTTIKTQDLTDPSNVLEAAIRTDTTTIETRSSPVVTTETLAEKLSLKDADRVSLHATETPVKIDIDSNVVASKQDLVISIESKQISSPIKVEDVSKIKEPMGLTLKTDHTAFVGKQPIVESTPERISPIKQIEKIEPIETVAKMAPDETIKIVEKEKVAVVKDSTPFKTKELDESKPKTLATETRKSPIKELVKEKITAKTAVSQPKQQMEVKLIEKVVPEKTEKTFAKMAPEKRVAEKVAEKTVAKMVPEKSIVEVIPEKRLTKTAVASKQPTKIPKVSEPIVQTEPIKKVTMDSRKSPIPSKIPIVKTQPIETRSIQKAIQKQPTPDDDVMKFLQKPIETLSKQVQQPTTDDEILEFLQKPFDTSTSSSQQIRVESIKDPTEMSTRPPETPKTIGVKDVAGAEEKLIIAQTKAKDVPIADTTSRSIAKTQVEVDQTRPKPEPSKPKITEKPAGTDAPKEVQRQPIVKEPVQKPTVRGEDVEKISQSQRTFRQPSERIRAMQEMFSKDSTPLTQSPVSKPKVALAKAVPMPVAKEIVAADAKTTVATVGAKAPDVEEYKPVKVTSLVSKFESLIANEKKFQAPSPAKQVKNIDPNFLKMIEMQSKNPPIDHTFFKPKKKIIFKEMETFKIFVPRQDPQDVRSSSPPSFIQEPTQADRRLQEQLRLKQQEELRMQQEQELRNQQRQMRMQEEERMRIRQEQEEELRLKQREERHRQQILMQQQEEERMRIRQEQEEELRRQQQRMRAQQEQEELRLQQEAEQERRMRRHEEQQRQRMRAQREQEELRLQQEAEQERRMRRHEEQQRQRMRAQREQEELRLQQEAEQERRMRQHQEQQRQRMRAQQEQERMMERRQRGSRPEAIEESMIDDYEELELEKQEKKKKSLLSFLKKKKKSK